MSFSRVSGVAAIGFAGTIVLTNALIWVPAGMPTTSAQLDEVTAFFRTSGVAVALASAFTPAAWILATLFGAGAVVAVWQSERERGEGWSLAGLAGLILQNGTFAGVIAVRLALAATAHDSSAVAGLWALQEALFTLNGTFLALALIGLSFSGLRSKIIRAWHAILGFVSATLLFSSATLTPLVMDRGGLLGLLGLVGWFIWAIWIILYGVALIRLTPNGHRRPVTART